MSGWWQIPPQQQSTYLGGPESASIEIPPFRPHFIKFQKYFFFRLTKFFFRNKKNFQGTIFIQFFMYCKAKKNFRAIRNFLKIYSKKSLKGWISIYADFGPPRYVFWCCGGICHEVLTFFQIGCGHTVSCEKTLFKYSRRQKIRECNSWSYFFSMIKTGYFVIELMIITNSDI